MAPSDTFGSVKRLSNLVRHNVTQYTWHYQTLVKPSLLQCRAIWHPLTHVKRCSSECHGMWHCRINLTHVKHFSNFVCHEAKEGALRAPLPYVKDLSNFHLLQWHGSWHSQALVKPSLLECQTRWHSQAHFTDVKHISNLPCQNTIQGGTARHTWMTVVKLSLSECVTRWHCPILLCHEMGR